MRRRVSVIITAHDAESTIEIPVRALAAQRLPSHVDMDVIVVDDRSADQTRGIAERCASANGLALRVLRIDAPPRAGVTARLAALEAAVDASDAPAIIVLDDDARIPNDFVARAVSMLEHADVVAYPIRYRPCTSSRAAHLIAGLQAIDAAFYHATARRVTRWGGAPAVCFGGAALRRTALVAIGGLRSLGYTLTEDLAFARAVHSAGGRVAFPVEMGAEVAGQPTVRQLRDRAMRVATAGGRSALAVALALPVATLPLLALLAGMGIVAPWLLAARWLVGAIVLARLARARGGSTTWSAPLLYEISAIALAISVARRALSAQRVWWGGISYELPAVGRTPARNAHT